MHRLSNKKKKAIIKSITDDLNIITYPPDYDGDYSFYMQKRREFCFNCYAYAMQFKFDASDLVYLYETYPYNPGVLGGIKNYELPKDSYSLIEYFLQDCKVLGIDVDFSTLAEKTYDDEYKIAILLSTDVIPTIGAPNYHYIRQNVDLSWSEMACFEGVVRHTEPAKEDFKTLEIVKVKKLTREDD